MHGSPSSPPFFLPFPSVACAVADNFPVDGRRLLVRVCKQKAKWLLKKANEDIKKRKETQKSKREAAKVRNKYSPTSDKV